MLSFIFRGPSLFAGAIVIWVFAISSLVLANDFVPWDQFYYTEKNEFSEFLCEDPSSDTCLKVAEEYISEYRVKDPGSWFSRKYKEHGSHLIYKGHRTKISVLFLHGLYEETSYFNSEQMYFNKMGFNTLSVTLPGHWPNDKKIRSVRYKNWQRAASSAFDLISSLGEKVIVFGRSTGGLLAFELALRKKKGLSGLVLIEPAFKVSLPIHLGACLAKKIVVKNKDLKKLAKFFGKQVSLDKDSPEFQKRYALRLGCEVTRLKNRLLDKYGEKKKGFKDFSNHVDWLLSDYRAMFKHLKVPTILVNNLSDQIVNPHYNKLLKSTAPDLVEYHTFRSTKNEKIFHGVTAAPKMLPGTLSYSFDFDSDEIYAEFIRKHFGLKDEIKLANDVFQMPMYYGFIFRGLQSGLNDLVKWIIKAQYVPTERLVEEIDNSKIVGGFGDFSYLIADHEDRDYYLDMCGVISIENRKTCKIYIDNKVKIEKALKRAGELYKIYVKVSRSDPDDDFFSEDEKQEYRKQAEELAALYNVDIKDLDTKTLATKIIDGIKTAWKDPAKRRLLAIQEDWPSIDPGNNISFSQAKEMLKIHSNR